MTAWMQAFHQQACACSYKCARVFMGIRAWVRVSHKEQKQRSQHKICLDKAPFDVSLICILQYLHGEKRSHMRYVHLMTGNNVGSSLPSTLTIL